MMIGNIGYITLRTVLSVLLISRGGLSLVALATEPAGFWSICFGPCCGEEKEFMKNYCCQCALMCNMELDSKINFKWEVNNYEGINDRRNGNYQ